MSGPTAKWCGWLGGEGDTQDLQRLRSIMLCAVGRGCNQSDPCSERVLDLIQSAARKEPSPSKPE